jgi:gliding motility-associated-like protein
MTPRRPIATLAAVILPSALLLAQPCLIGWTLTQSPLPTSGTYGCGETVTFCLTVTNWNQTNANWFHGIVANFGPGWDISTLTPGPPPPTCSATAGQWGWYNSVQGTAWTNVGPQGPGFFFDNPPDGNPGNNFGDNCTGSPNWQFCWTISVLSPPACVDGLSLSVTFNTFSDSETGSWGSMACTNDPIVPSLPAVILACSVTAGTPGTLALCSTAAPVALFPLLGGSPNAGGTWTNPSGAAHSGTFNPAVDPPGAYTYTVTGSGNCSSSAAVTVSVAQQPNAGANGSTSLCSSEGPVNLSTLLGGTPSPGGVWTGPGGAASNGTFVPGTSSPGVYTYTVTATAPCVDVSATVTVNVVAATNAGTNGTLTVCTNDPAPANLFNALGGSPSAGGTWTGPSGGAFGGVFNPATDPGGVYTYTVAGALPCPTTSATVTVNAVPQPNAGTNGTATLCSTDAPVALANFLGGTPDAGGTWTGPGGVVLPGSINPATAASGVYTYTVSAPPPCASATATVNVTIHTQQSAGLPGAITLCDGSGATDLFTALGGSPAAGGTWTGPGGAPATGTFTPGVSTPGAYTYTVNSTAPCVTTSATVNVTVTSQPWAGVDALSFICTSNGPADLFAALGGNPQPGGIWTGPGGTPFNGTFLPGTSPDGVYTYTVSGTPPCVPSSATVTVATTQASDPGISGPFTTCTTAGPVDLFAQLGGSPEPGGSWTTPSGGVSNGTIDPATAPAGNYTYTLPPVGPCPAVSSFVAVTVVPAPNAGTNGTATLCSSAAPYDLISALGGSPNAGGTWTGPAGGSVSGTISPALALPGTYTYTVSAPPPCASASSTVDLTIVPAASAGIGGSVSLCENAAVVDPSTWLGGSPDAGGTWSGPGGGAITAVDPSTAASGPYTYTVQGTAPCPAAQAVVQLSITTLPNAGTDGTLNLCTGGLPVPLSDGLGGGAQTGGTWSGPTGPSNGIFVPGSSAPGAYTYTVNGTGPCAAFSDNAVVTVAVLPLPVPAIVFEPAAGCAPLQVLFINTAPQGIQSATWTFGDGTTANDPVQAWHTYAAGGTYSVQLQVTDINGCSASVTVPNAVFVSNGPNPAFGVSANTLSVENPMLDIEHAPQDGIVYTWTIDGNAVQGGERFTHLFNPPTLGEHIICLTATDAWGCSNEVCRTVLIDDVLTVYVANAFTPNGDGINDLFKPSVIGADPERYVFTVFDRWGSEVFNTRDLNDAWNGAYRNAGEVLPQGVYVWRVVTRDQFTTEQRELRGAVTLLK